MNDDGDHNNNTVVIGVFDVVCLVDLMIPTMAMTMMLKLQLILILF